MSCDGYSKTAMMGNWYEERLAVTQPFRQQPDFRATREQEEAISFLSNKNLLEPLGRVSRAHKWNTSHIIVDDGFREFKTENKTTYDPIYLQNRQTLRDCRSLVKTEQQRKEFPEFATQIQTSGAVAHKILSEDNILPQVLENKRDVRMYPSDFGSTFRTHNKDHNRFYGITTYHAYHDKPTKPTPEEVIKTDGAKMQTLSGWNKVRHQEQTGPKIVGGLIGEVYKDRKNYPFLDEAYLNTCYIEKDPQQNTRIQRAWLPYNETALNAVEGNIYNNTLRNTQMGIKTNQRFDNYRQNTSQKFPYDIATSLPLEGGLESIRPKFMEPGAYRRIRTDVTLIRNNPITKK